MSGASVCDLATLCSNLARLSCSLQGVLERELRAGGQYAFADELAEIGKDGPVTVRRMAELAHGLRERFDR